jgi:hypothetical protein
LASVLLFSDGYKKMKRIYWSQIANKWTEYLFDKNLWKQKLKIDMCQTAVSLMIE